MPEWESLGLEEKKLFIRQMDVYGAYLAYTDYEIGRVIQAVQDMGQLDNTLIIYISGDNGASAEGMLNGTPNEFTFFNGVQVPVKDQLLWYPFWGSDRTYPHYSAGWAWAMSTPFKWVKQVASHFGGTAQGIAMSWPGHINDVGGIRRQFHHVIDIVPTILDVTGIAAPDMIDGIKQRPIEGVSMAYTWDKASANAPTRHNTQYFEMLGNRAIYQNGWVAATTPATLPWAPSTGTPPDVITGYKWELYNVEADPTQSNDLAVKMPDKLKQMQDLFYAEARKYDVLPLDNSSLVRFTTPRPSLTAGRTDVHLYKRHHRRPQQRRTAHPEQVIHNHSRGRDSRRWCGRRDRHRRWTLRGVRIVPEQRGPRVSARGKPVFMYNLLDLKRTTWAGPELKPGKHTIVFDFKSDAPGLGKGGTGVLWVDGKEVARNSMEHSTPITFQGDESFDVGQDTRTGVAMLDYRYDSPFKFTGKINRVTIKLDEPEAKAKQ